MFAERGLDLTRCVAAHLNRYHNSFYLFQLFNQILGNGKKGCLIH